MYIYLGNISQSNDCVHHSDSNVDGDSYALANIA